MVEQAHGTGSVGEGLDPYLEVLALHDAVRRCALQILIDGQDFTGYIGQVGYMLQKDLLLPWRTVLDNVALGMEISGVPMKEARARALPLIIGFVGLVVPHIVRLVVGPSHRSLLPVSLLAGAALLGIADLLSRTLIAPNEIPVGVVTTFVGAPLFVYLLRRGRRA